MEPLRAQLMTLSRLVVTKPFSITPSRLIASPRQGCSFPFQCAFLPLVYEAHHEDCKEHHHRREAEEPDVVQHDGPREEEGDLQVEQDEQDRDEVIAHV